MKRICILLLSCLLIVTSLIVLPGCKQDRVVLNIYNWGEYIDPDLLVKFEKKPELK